MELKLDNKRFTILWSGGKDSTATLLWVLNNVRNADFNVLYIEITGNTDQRCNDYVHKVAESLGIEDKLIFHRATYNGLDFYELMDRWGVPIIKYRWCLYKLKNSRLQIRSD
jgi:Phosphoadenosine phosphosulfate reductase family.